ncbi:alpha-soluble NSF attachment protein isoform X2 [Bombyx mandarina]|uniref:Alpha-soluble NSF attachment protein n=2 Tax=Bombyx TaxID=7090 RepID=A0A8R2AG35_BOMMO|nr:alpha-soluble NSF attachment protein [Bombyx mori]XP_028039206.1 alpha-soluble NSF attachment protein isoform X1 [Bombyx mandarina]XP_028039207.1 alpha-soluble NSF attachment protein isoform X2 [Bombyx mandarina]
MADNEQKAMQLMAEAEKKLSSSKSFLGSLFGGSSKIEEAVDCYLRAANLFKMAKKWPQAGQAFCNAAQLHLKAGVRHDAATNFVDASNCYKKCDANEAVSCLLKAIEIYTDMGRFTVAAKQHQNIAELYETECVDLARAMQHYEQAADYFRGEESTSSANKCMLKLAQYAAQLEHYDKAIQIYEQIAKSSLDNSLLKYSAKEYMFRAALCHLCVDILNAQHALEKYSSLYPAFGDTREYKLIKELIEHLEDQNVDAYTEAVKTYDSISRLDQWYTTMLVRIKKQINDNPDLR